MNIKLSDHFTYGRLLKYTLPTIVMMVFISVYTVVDGLFVSNYVGKTAFAALNLIIPFPMVMGAAGFMLGSGGSAIISNTLGLGDTKRANGYFSLLIYVGLGLGIVLAAIGLWVLRPVAIALGADDALIGDCMVYGSILMLAVPAYMLQTMFQSFFSVAEKPQLGLYITLVAGFANALLDYVFIVPLDMGIAGAAWATAIGQAIGGFVPIIYFAAKNNSLLRLGRARLYGKMLGFVCVNGSSELMTNIAISLVAMFYNYRLMAVVGQNGIAAYGIIMYLAFLFNAIFIGYAMGTAPVVGYHYGAANKGELKSLLGRSLVITAVFGLGLTALAVGLTPWVAAIFVGYDKELFALTCSANRLYSINYLICGFNIFASAFFTAMGNGLVSALISFLRTLVFQVLCVLVLPLLWGINGIWLAVTVAEGLSLVLSLYFIFTNGKKYGYMG